MKATHKQTLLYFGIFVAAIVSWGLLGDWSFACEYKEPEGSRAAAPIEYLGRTEYTICTCTCSPPFV